MLADRQTAGRQQPIRLSDVPLKIRRREGQRLIDRCALDGDLVMAAALQRAIEHPSPRVYWLPVEAVRRVLR